MHCDACDALLTDFEATRKVKSTGEYLNLCNTCYAPISDDVPTIVRKDLVKDDTHDGNDEEV